MKKKLRAIKKQLKQQGLYKKYKTQFKHKQMKLLISKIVLIFNSEADIIHLFELEKSLIEKEVNEKMFDETLLSFESLTGKKANWALFSIFLFYVYQTSTFWRDMKKGVKNVYSLSNYNELNLKKRQAYNAWFKSMEIDLDFNSKLIQVLRSCY